jgi:hypothetical protein
MADEKEDVRFGDATLGQLKDVVVEAIGGLGRAAIGGVKFGDATLGQFKDVLVEAVGGLGRAAIGGLGRAAIGSLSGNVQLDGVIEPIQGTDRQRISLGGSISLDIKVPTQ